MRRAKPDRLQFAIWAAANLRFGERCSWRAWGLWNHWCEHARAAGVAAGTPRSFSNEMRKIGCPWSRGYREWVNEYESRLVPRTRVHVGASLAVQRPGIDEPVSAHLDYCARYAA